MFLWASYVSSESYADSANLADEVLIKCRMQASELWDTGDSRKMLEGDSALKECLIEAIESQAFKVFTGEDYNSAKNNLEQNTQKYSSYSSFIAFRQGLKETITQYEFLQRTLQMQNKNCPCGKLANHAVNSEVSEMLVEILKSLLEI